MTFDSSATHRRDSQRRRGVRAAGLVGAALISAGIVIGAGFKRDVRWACDAPDRCRVDAIWTDAARTRIYEGPLRSPGLRWHGDDLAEFRSSCGSPCSTSWFVEFSSRRVSKAMQQVIGVSPETRLAVVAGESAIEVWRIFEGETPLMRIERDFPPVASLTSIIEAVEFEGHYLRLRYSARDGRIAEEQIELP